MAGAKWQVIVSQLPTTSQFTAFSLSLSGNNCRCGRFFGSRHGAACEWGRICQNSVFRQKCAAGVVALFNAVDVWRIV